MTPAEIIEEQRIPLFWLRWWMPLASFTFAFAMVFASIYLGVWGEVASAQAGNRYAPEGITDTNLKVWGEFAKTFSWVLGAMTYFAFCGVVVQLAFFGYRADKTRERNIQALKKRFGNTFNT